MRAATVAEFATVSAAAVPIDTPSMCFTPDDLSYIAVATGLAYPAKAECARRNPKVGLLIEGVAPGEPIVSIAGIARVRDDDIQANAMRHIAETALGAAVTVPWNVALQAACYGSRIIIIEVTPARISWWDSREAMDGPPHCRDAPASTIYHPSDSAPKGSTSAAPKWGETPWRELAASALASGMPAHLSVIDESGYPLPLRVADIAPTDAGVRFCIPSAAPWPAEP